MQTNSGRGEWHPKPLSILPRQPLTAQVHAEHKLRVASPSGDTREMMRQALDDGAVLGFGPTQLAQV